MPAFIPRLFVDAPLAEGGRLSLTSDQAHYLKSVMRRGVGGRLSLFNGVDGQWRGTLEALSRKSGSVRVGPQERRQEEGPDIWLLPALLKQTPFGFVVEKSVELGISALQPIVTQHTGPQKTNRDRLQARIREAAEQCGRLSVPTVFDVKSLEACLQSWDPERLLLVGDEREEAPSLRSVLDAFAQSNTLPEARPKKWALCVGPEGGFSEQEFELFAAQPFVRRVHLGPRILRAETAALALLSCWQAILGDWERD